MSEEKDESAKTEEPTPKRLEDAIKSGNVAYSKEVTSFIFLTLIAITIIWLTPFIAELTTKKFGGYITDFDDLSGFAEDGRAMALFKGAIYDFLIIMALPLVIGILSALFGSFVQNGIIYSEDALKFDTSRISPLSGFKRIFSKQSLIEFIKGLFKIMAVGLIAYFVIKEELDVAIYSVDYDLRDISSILLHLTAKLFIAVCVFVVVIAAMDYLYTRFQYIQNLRMSKQEVRDEMKESEGSPEIKSKIRQLRKNKLRRRMLADVAKADVVITNPTHYSIALKYDRLVMPAPKLIAKGQDKVALKIREIAKKLNIPMIESKLLARTLYDEVDLDETIPIAHYRAVAEIINKITEIKKRGF